MNIFRKISLLLLLVSTIPAYAASIISIEKWMIEHANDNPEYIASYMSKRCSATFMVVAKIFGEKEKNVFDRMVNYATDLQNQAVYIDNEKNNSSLLETADLVQGDVKRIFDILWENAEDSYAKTGVYLAPIQEDLGYCRLFVGDEN